ncbi:daxx-like protein [Bicyclus anynana]|uniref:Daxx-like protein n=1 Tax=Bicyclus anynana TaxID=110368 RepID=A0A6J1P1E2_BICAN|nr:daxx-like protein [Bicyclus anynana]
MASEDVIELGSSEDEAEPVPIKRKYKPNAMVCIPSKLPGVTIKPKPIVVSNVIGKVNPTQNKMISIPVKKNINTRKPNNKSVTNNIKIVSAPHVQNKLSINPLTLAKHLNKPQLVVKKVPQNKNIVNLQNKKVLSSLPPSVTVTPLLHNADVINRTAQKAGASGMLKKRRIIVPKRKLSGELLTVELDDDDTSETITSPHWYLTPEDQIKKQKSIEKEKATKEASMEVDSVKPSMEEINNKEPDTPKYVEITIEDSPLKPVHSPHPDIGKELPIVIEDSPLKPHTKAANDNDSDSEIGDSIQEKQSKKKLDYPKESNKVNDKRQVEIEIDFEKPVIVNDDNSKTISPKLIEETEKSPLCVTDVEKVNVSETKDIEQTKENSSEHSEFHPTYLKFIDMCFQLENTDDMKKIVEKKIKAYYRQCTKDYVESEEFIDMVSSKIDSMKASPEKMYLYIKDIVDELNLQRKMKKPLVSNVATVVTEKESPSAQSQYDHKKTRQIRKLEKTTKKLHRAIQKLEELEVDFDDEEDSVYLLTERYKERLVRVHAKLCQLTNTKMPSEPRICIEARPGRPTGPAKKLEKLINRKVPIGTPLPFPDFHDVLRCVKDANEENKLGWTDIDVMEEARDLFTRCGKKLQRRRQENEWRIAASRITAEADPAEDNLDLKKKLEENKSIAARKETELFNKYVERQNSLKLEAEEIGDKEAEETALESEEDDDVGNDNSLENKQKRKQKLKSLLKEKNKKDAVKENEAKKDCMETDQNENNHQTENEKSDDKASVKAVDNVETIPETSNDATVVESRTPHETANVQDKENESVAGKYNNKNENSDSDTYNVESDIDELHLLQKLHSGSEVNSSSFESSDSDTPIAISDTLDSGSEVDNYKYCDVISIENSSYSESEIIDGSSDNNEANSSNKEITADIEMEYSSTGVEDTNKEAQIKDNTTIKETDENIFISLSDEEVKDKLENVEIEETCINFTDDNISITENIVVGITVETSNLSNNGSSVPEINNPVEIIADSPNSEESDITDKVVKDATSETVNINESNDKIVATKDVDECNTQTKMISIEKAIIESLTTTETSNCEIHMEI